MLNELKTFDLWEQGLGIPPTLPSFYWNVYSYEQRIKEICLRLQRMMDYQDVSTDKINELITQVNKLTEELDALTKEVARINQALLDEISARQAGDQKLETELQQEINDRVKAVSDEATTRQAQVDKLTTDLETEATTRQAQVDKLTTDLETEAKSRADADSKLTTNLATEVADRKQADNNLQGTIDNVETNLVAETTNRKDADSALDTRVTQNTTQLADEVTARTNLGNSLTEAITNERTAREAKDKELDQQIANLTADQPSIESDNIYTAGDKLPTVTAIQNSVSQAVTADNKIATMADIGGGANDVNVIAPLSVSEPASIRQTKYSVAIGNNAYVLSDGVHGSVAIGNGSSATTGDVVSVGNGDNRVYRRLVNVADPQNSHDAATRGYVVNHNAKTFINNSLTTSGLGGYEQNISITPDEVYQLSWSLKNNSGSVVVNTGTTTLSYVASSGNTVTCAEFNRQLDSGATASYSAIFSVHDSSSLRIYAGDTSNLITITGYTLSEIKTDTTA